jgi:hypothetical protein
MNYMFSVSLYFFSQNKDGRGYVKSSLLLKVTTVTGGLVMLLRSHCSSGHKMFVATVRLPLLEMCFVVVVVVQVYSYVSWAQAMEN